MNKWLERHREKIIHGLLISVLALLVILVMRGSMSKEIARVKKDNDALTAVVEARGEALERERAAAKELALAREADKAEAAKLASANEELSARVASLDASLAGAMAKIDRLDFADITRGEKTDLIQSQIDGLKKDAELAAGEISKLHSEFDNALGRAIDASSTEKALPALPDAKVTLALKIADTSGFAAMGETLFKTLAGLAEGGNEIPSDALTAARALWSFAASTSEMSAVIEPSKDPRVYISCFADDEAFHKFIGRSGYDLYRFEQWPGQRNGWKFFDNGERYANAEPIFYISKLRVKGGKSLILIARDEDGIAEMTDAARGESPSFDAGRATSGENFCQVKFRDGVTFEGITTKTPSAIADILGEAMLPDSASDSKRVVGSVLECSWTRDGLSINFDLYSDLFKQKTDLLSTRPALPYEAEIFGDGDLAFYASANLGFLFRCLYFGSTESDDQTFSRLSVELSHAFSDGELRSILERGRASLVCVSDAGKISAAYVMLECDAKGAFDKLLSIGHAMSGEPAVIDGWESAMSWFPGTPFNDNLNLVLAKNGGRVALGLTSNVSFAKKLSVPADLREYVLNDNLASVVASPKIFDVIIVLIDDAVSAKTVNLQYDSSTRNIYNYSGALRDSFDVMRWKLPAGGNGVGQLVLREGGDPFGAYMRAFAAEMEIKYPKKDTKGAAIIINDLRNLKSASLLYYADNFKWPTQSEAADIEKYMDSSRETMLDKYERVTITEYKDDRSQTRFNIGLTLKEENGSHEIRRALESQADEYGLLSESDDPVKRYKMDSMTVFINMR